MKSKRNSNSAPFLGAGSALLVVLWLTTAIASPAQTFTTLHSFDFTDGFIPYGTLVQGTDGNLYGTTYWGGANDCTYSNGYIPGCGTVFSITPGGTLTTLYNFCSQSNCTDGSLPAFNRLVQGANGDFYGTTQNGGANNNGACIYGGSGIQGCGTVFSITPSGTLTTLYNFCSQSNCTDGNYPQAGLVLGTDGNFYGTTLEGGVSYYCGGQPESTGCGTVFRITPSGTLTTLHSFDGTDGRQPGALVQGTDGNLYGTTINGGANGPNTGTVFRITPGGTLTTLYNFCSQSGCADGSNPDWGAALVQGTDGNFYGTTEDRGGQQTYENGTIFKITPSGTLTTLYTFAEGQGSPQSSLIQATDGNLYGTVVVGGANGQGA